MKFLFNSSALLLSLMLLIGTQTVVSQTNPAAQGLPVNQNFGTTSFNTLPAGFAAWNGLNGANITTQALAEASTPTGTATVTARTATSTTAGVSGLSIDSNGRVYIQTSGNTTNGVNQLALAINTKGKENITLSFDVRHERKGGDATLNRAVGVVAQYRIGTSGSWTTIAGSAQVFFAEAAGTVVSRTNLALGSNANNQAVVQIRWATWRGATQTGVSGGASGGIGIDNVNVNGTEIPNLPPSIADVSSSSSSLTTANLSSNVLASGGLTVTSRGFVYALKSVNANPTIGGTGVTTVNVGSGIGSYNQTISGLETTEVYTARAFATNSAGTTYSSPLDFTSLAALPVSGYTQTFSTFNSANTIPRGWSVSDGTYSNTWGSGTSFGLRGNASVLGFQLTTGMSSFSTTLKLGNNTGEAINQLTIGYTGRAARLSLTEGFPGWTVTVNGVEAASLAYSTSSAANVNADQEISAIISGLNIAHGEAIEIVWSTSFTFPETSFDVRQIGISNVSVSKSIQASASLSQAGGAGFRTLATPVPTTFANFLAPIWTQGATGADVTNGTPNVWQWNQNATTLTNENWQPVTDLNTDIVNGRGFLVYVFANNIFGDNTSNTWPKVLNVTGVPANLPLSPALNPNSNGLSFLGNPANGTLTWSTLRNNSARLQDAVYVYNPAKPGWDTYVAGVGDLTGGLIAPFQGFFVQTVASPASAPTLSITSSALTSGGTLRGKTSEPIGVRLQLDGAELTASTWFTASESAQTGRDDSDALQLQPLAGDYAQLASQVEDGTLLSINNFPLDLGQSLTFPLAVEATRGGTFTITASQFNLPLGWKATLFDSETGTSTELDISTSYTFEMEAIKRSKENPEALFASGDLLSKAEAGRFSVTFEPGTVSVEIGSDLPQELALFQNYPNPFNPTTIIKFDLPASENVVITVYDLLGRVVDVLVNQEFAAGTHTVNFDASNLSSGVYIYRLEAGGQVLTRKMTMLK